MFIFLRISMIYFHLVRMSIYTVDGPKSRKATDIVYLIKILARFNIDILPTSIFWLALELA
jgi:hypothetical protein